MTLAEIKEAATGKYAITDALLLNVSDPVEHGGCLHQTLTAWDESGDHDIAVYCGVDMLDMLMTKDDVGKGWKFRVRTIVEGPLVLLQGHEYGEPTKGTSNE